jgi:FdhD protein
MFVLQKGRLRRPRHDMIDHLHPRNGATATQILSVQEDVVLDRTDWLAPEEPLEIRVQGPGQDALSVAVTMRTPGDDDELTIGFLYTEGLIHSRAEIVHIEANTRRLDGQPCNTATVTLSHPFDLAPLKRNFYATSSCGICGKASLEQIAVHCDPVAPGSVIARSSIVELPHALRQAQQLFARTGGLHATGLFDLTGQLLLVREDVGRHNAVDKVVGHHVLAGESSLAEHVLMVSGRLSFEIMQKAAMARVPIVCAVSAPSSLAVQVARRFGMTVVGFLRDRHFNVYTHPERIALDR